jgi:hypothetical protein
MAKQPNPVSNPIRCTRTRQPNHRMLSHGMAAAEQTKPPDAIAKRLGHRKHGNQKQEPVKCLSI